MNVYGELVSAQLENNASDPTGTVTGKILLQTTLGKIRFADGTNAISILANDQKCVFGTSGTAAQNIRFNRGAIAVLQFLTGDDVTAEGSLSTALAQLSFKVEGYATGSLPVAANEGRLLFDSTLKTLIYDNGTILVTLGGASTALDNLSSVAINTSLISDTDSTDDLGSSAISWKDTYSDSYYIENGAQIISSSHVLVAGDFPDSTTLYGWNNSATGAWADQDWVGAIALTQVGAISTATNHIGTASTYIDFDGTNDELYAAVATFDSANESFTTGGWFYFDLTGTDEYLISKDETDNADKSFIVHHDNTGANLTFSVYYNNAAGKVTITIDDALVTDSTWHHIVAVYDQANTWIKLYVDGHVVGHLTDANLATRNNGTTSELAFGGRYDTAVAAIEKPFDGKIADMFYKIDVLTENEIKKIFVAGSLRLAVEDGGTGNINLFDSKCIDTCYISDVKAANTSGGGFTQGGWRTRVLNTINTDGSNSNVGCGWCTIASEQFTLLDPGVYDIEISAPSWYTIRHKAALYNITTSAYVTYGSSEYSDNTSTNGATRSFVKATVTINAATIYEVRHYCEATEGTRGFGIESNLGVSEVYTMVKINKRS